MLKRYKNALFDAIQTSGLEVSDFEGDDSEPMHGEVWSFRITHLPTDLTFTVFPNASNPHRFTAYGAMYAGERDAPALSNIGDSELEDVILFLKRWLHRSIRVALDEALLPDLWLQLSESPLATVTGDSDSRFEPDERERIRMAVSTFRLLLIERFSPSAEQLNVVNEKLDYLVSAADRLNRFDWRSVAIAVLLDVTLALSLDTERGRQLYGLFREAFASLQHLLR